MTVAKKESYSVVTLPSTKDESSFEAKSDATYVEIDLINDDSCEEIVEDHPNTEPEDRVEDPTPRRSTRQRNRPDYYEVYVNLVEIGNEPTIVSEALAGDDKEKWKNTMNCEYKFSYQMKYENWLILRRIAT